MDSRQQNRPTQFIRLLVARMLSRAFLLADFIGVVLLIANYQIKYVSPWYSLAVFAVILLSACYSIWADERQRADTSTRIRARAKDMLRIELWSVILYLRELRRCQSREKDCDRIMRDLLLLEAAADPLNRYRTSPLDIDSPHDERLPHVELLEIITNLTAYIIEVRGILAILDDTLVRITGKEGLEPVASGADKLDRMINEFAANNGLKDYGSTING